MGFFSKMFSSTAPQVSKEPQYDMSSPSDENKVTFYINLFDSIVQLANPEVQLKNPSFYKSHNLSEFECLASLPFTNSSNSMNNSIVVSVPVKCAENNVKTLTAAYSNGFNKFSTVNTMSPVKNCGNGDSYLLCIDFG